MKSMVWRASLLALGACLFATAAQAQDVLWRTTLQLSGETTTARHVALLNDGDAIVGGSVGTATANRDFLVYRINGATGAVKWTRRFDGGATNETVVDLMADPATGDTWFCGSGSQSGQGLNWKVMKLNGSDGSNGWSSVYTYNHTSNGNDAPRACTFVQDGAVKNIVVAGQISTAAGNGGRVAKINAATGAEMWAVNKTNVFQEYVFVTSEAGDIYATGSSSVDGFQVAAMVSKFNAAGTEAWTVHPKGTGTESLINITNAAIEPGGDLITSGFSNVNNLNDIWICRFNKTTGAKTWQQLINGPGNGLDGGQAIAVDATHIYIGTGQYSQPGGGTDLFLARLSLANGASDAANGGWTASFGGDAAASQENLQNLKLVNGVVYAAGSTQYLTPGRVLTTLKLNATTGATINRTNFLDRVGVQLQSRKAMQVTANGDMIIAGDSATAGFAEVGRFGGASGTTDANLSALSISTGTLTPSFSASQQSYTASVGNGTTSMTVTPTVAQSGATVRVNGTLTTSGSASAPINLVVGLNDIAIVVTAPDGTTTKTYNLTVTRDVCPTCPPPWTSIEAMGNISIPFSSMARNASDVVYGIRLKDSGANGHFRLYRYDNPGPSGTWATVGEFTRANVPNILVTEDEVSLAIDKTGRFHVAFKGRNDTTSGVYYATSPNGATGNWTFTELATITGINTGVQDVVVKTDPTNNLPRVTYVSTDATGARAYKLYVLQLNNNVWSSTQLLGQTGSNEIRVPDLDIDSTGKIHVAFEAETNGSGTDGSLMYVNNTTGSFPAPTNVVAGSTGNEQARSLSLVLDSADKVHIVRADQTNRLFHTTNASGTFVSTQLNGSLTGTVRPDSLSRNDFNDLYLAYRDTNIELRYAYLPGATGSSWLTGRLYRGNLASFTRYSGVVTNTRFGFAFFDHRPAGPSGNQELWAAIQLLPAPEIVVEQPAGTDIADNGSKGYGNVSVGSNSSLTFSVRNIGAAPLTLGAITINGTNAADFSVTTNPASSVAAGGSTTFVLRFAPGAVGARSAAIHIANNDANENPFDINLTGTGVNTPPVITPASALTRQRGSSATSAPVATVSDAETAAASLTVTAPTVPAGLTVASLANSNGNVSAVVTASCSATLGANTVVLRVADAAAATTDGNLTVNVTANTAPTLSYDNQSVAPGGSLAVSPNAGSGDTGISVSYAVQSAGTYGGTVSVNASGVVSLGNAAPSGTHTITIRATDNCGATTDASFTVAINAPPTVTPATGLTRQRGTAAANATLGSVADTETPAASIGVAANAPAGVVVGTLVNTAGAISAPLSATCTAPLGNNTVVLTATDGAGSTATGNVVVAVTVNTAPALAYANHVVAPGGVADIDPATPPSDNGGVPTLAILSQGTYTGTISVAQDGRVLVSNAAPAGAHTIVVRATDNCGATTDASFELLVNTPPTITAATPSARQGTPAAVATLATVADGESGAGTLTLNVTSVPAGITMTGLVNDAGTVRASLAASCSATPGTNLIGLSVSDGRASASTDVSVDVLANTPPALSYTDRSVAPGGSLTVNAEAGAGDNGTATYSVLSTGTYTGTISVNALGTVSISNAAPSGTHTLTIRATDNCGATTDASFTLSINGAPTVTPAVGLARQQGTAPADATLGTVADTETAPGSLTVNATVPSGLVLGTLLNSTGTVTAPLSASCNATLGNNTVVLAATDGAGSTGSGNVIVAVSANTAPTLAYADRIVAPGGSADIDPSTALGDNGSIDTLAVQSQGGYTGTISVATDGRVTIAGAAPAGAHVIVIRAIDNCGAVTDASFELLVNTAPTITAATPSLRQGTPPALTALATVADGESAAGTLTVNTTAVPAGIALTGLANDNGTVQAMLSASCVAATGANTVGLSVSDGRQGANTDVSVEVLTNTPPALTYANQFVQPGDSLSVNPGAGSGDNGSVASYVVSSQGSFTGTVSVDAAGTVAIGAAAPQGTHTLVIRATDNCGATTDASFTLAVNGLPTVTPAAGLTRQRGTAPSDATLASVADAETAATDLAVVGTAPAGIVLGTLLNTAGAISAPLSATCSAALGDNTVVLTATDGAGSTGTGNVVIAVTDNTPPTLAYADRIVAPGATLTLDPTTALGDNGSIDTLAVQPGTYTGAISVNAAGQLAIANAGPPGLHTIVVHTVDNCGAVTDASFELLVNTPPVIAAAAASLRQGSLPAVTALATVSDGETAAGLLAVTTTSVPAGVVLTGLTNNGGTVQASLAAACNAPIGAGIIGVTVDDGRQTASADAGVDLQANTPPAVAYAAQLLPSGGSALLVPTTAPNDNGSLAGLTLHSTGTYTGIVSLDTQGRLTFANAAPVGTHTLLVRLIDNCGSITDQPVSVTVAPGSATLQLSSSVSPSRYGQPVMLTADVSGTAPTGTVEFLADDVALGSAPLTGSGDNRSAMLTTTALPVGNPVLTARYSGDAQHVAGEVQLGTQLVQAATTRVTLTPDANPAAPGNHAIAVQVQPVAPGGGTPEGTVNVTAGLANCNVALVAGAGSCTLNLAVTGAQRIVGSYVPSNDNHVASSANVGVVVADASASGDVRVRIGNGRDFIEPGSTLAYQVTVDNIGPDAVVARVQVPISPVLSGATFQCLQAGPAQCGIANGSGDIDSQVELGVGGVVLFTIDATAPFAPNAPISQSASATVVAPGTDPNPANNSATDVDPMGMFRDGFEDANADE